MTLEELQLLRTGSEAQEGRKADLLVNLLVCLMPLFGSLCNKATTLKGKTLEKPNQHLSTA
jgi:hypothetical protein